MARRVDRLPENAPGDFFVDASCIDCDLCRQLAPDTFARADLRGQSYVARQPLGGVARDRALRALVTCPTASIGAGQRHGARAASRAFPERILDGPGPWRLDDDLLVIAVPGHTRGSCALLYRDTFLFSGDHLWADEEGGGLAAGRDVCWWSWDAQRRSVAKLADHRFAWVLPGHGRRYYGAPEAMRAEVLRLAAAM